MPRLTDMQIRAWIGVGGRLDGKTDDNGPYIRYPKNYTVPFWRFRYKLVGKQWAMIISLYSKLSLPKTREVTEELLARVVFGCDITAEKQERKAGALAKMEAEKDAMHASDLASECFERQILPRWEHPDIFRRRINKGINPYIGHIKVEDIRPRHVDDMLKGIVDRGASAIVADVLRWTCRIFDYGIRCHALEVDLCSAFKVSDAGGKKVPRGRWLTRNELIRLFEAIRTAEGLSHQNELASRLLLTLYVRKVELCAVRWGEFDLDGAMWHLPEERSKDGDPADIPLPSPVAEWLRELYIFSHSSTWALPARRVQNRMIPHVQESILPIVLAKVCAEMPDMPSFTIHDFRRTVRTHLAASGVSPVIAERCLDHRIEGVEGVYNHHQYFDEHKAVLVRWTDLLMALEGGKDYNTMPLDKARRQM